jgi:hypothetical protein
MKALLIKLLSLFSQPEPTKPVEAAKATPKKRVSVKPKKVAAKAAPAVKKPAVKKKAK